MTIVPANSQTRPNPPAKTRLLRIIVQDAGLFGIINRNPYLDASEFGISPISGKYPYGYPLDPQCFFKYF